MVVGTDLEGKALKFTHPYFQCAVMFLGELFCLMLFGIKRTLFGNPNGEENKISPFRFAVPAMLDICGSSLMFIALTLCAASVYQMMRGTIVVITAIMALVFLGKKQYAHHWISLFTIVLGVFFVGFVSVMAAKETTSAEATSITGIVILLIAQCFSGA